MFDHSLGEKLAAGSSQIVTLVILLHNFLEPFGVDPNICLQAMRPSSVVHKANMEP